MTNNQNKNIPVRIPQNLDCESLAKGRRLGFKYNPDKVKFIIDLLILQLHWDKRIYESKQVPFVELPSKQLKLYVPDYNKYIRLLIDTEVLLQSPNNYSVGNYSIAYQFTRKYQVQTKGDFIRDPKLVDSIYEKIALENQDAIRRYPHLVKWIPGLKIDSLLVEQWAHHEFSKSLSIAESYADTQKAYFRYANCIQSASRINRKFSRYVVDSKGHRLHHVLTNMKSELRNALTHNNRPLVNLDLSSSQVYLLLVLISDSFYSESKLDSERLHYTDLDENVQDLIREVIDDVRVLVRKINTPPRPRTPAIASSNGSGTGMNQGTIEFADSLLADLNHWFGNETRESGTTVEELRVDPSKEQGVGLPMCENWDDYYMCEGISDVDLAICNRVNAIDDWNKLRTQVEAGQFYEYMLDRTRELRPGWQADRSLMKTTVFSVLFSKNTARGQTIRYHKDLFLRLFPSVYSVLKAFKSNQHNRLALVLQNIESVLFLGRIAKRISRERPDVPLLTIHDSISTTVGNEHYVESVIREELTKAVDARPFINLECWERENLLRDLDPEYY